ncbi:MAG TPA: fibronectin type III domain-containing protein, partial [Bdellovibrio sp.]|nr:fibronectin type III domain-containing protein [Bdellovibrio sp.]
YFLYDDSLLFPKAKNDRLELIGDFVVSQNDVRRKNIDTFSWLPVSHKDNIYQNDSVFTGDRSEAVLHLQDGTEIHLEANSLIALTSKNGQLNLDLRYGNLVGEIAKNSALVVKSGGEEIKLESTETSTTEKSKVHVNKTRSGNVDLKLLTGQVQLSDKTKTKTALVKDSVVAVSTKGEVKKIEPVQVHLKTADLNQSRVSADDPISLEWEGQGPISHFELEIAQTPDFNSVTLSKVTPENQIKITDPLEPGNYFVRIKAYDRNGEVGAQSTPQKLSLQLLTAPVITAPQKSTEISQELKVKSPEDLVTTTEIKWEAPAPFKNFTYQISQDPTFAQILKEEKTVASSAISPRLASGTYWLRVSGQVTPQSHPAWSEPVSFKINLVAKKE